MKRLFWAMMLTIVPCGIVSCGDGFDTEDATASCEADRTRLPNCFDDETFNLCVACHEECGDTCSTLDTVCPVRFTCPSDD